MSRRNLPGFTAEISLYRASGHYRTGKSTIIPSTRMTGSIHQAATATEENGVIIIVDDAPFEMPWGWGPWGWTGSGGGGGPVGGLSDGGGGGGGSGGTGPRPRPTPEEKRAEEKRAKEKRCKVECEDRRKADRIDCDEKYTDRDDVTICNDAADNRRNRCLTRCEELYSVT